MGSGRRTVSWPPSIRCPSVCACVTQSHCTSMHKAVQLRLARSSVRLSRTTHGRARRRPTSASAPTRACAPLMPFPSWLPSPSISPSLSVSSPPQPTVGLTSPGRPTVGAWQFALRYTSCQTPPPPPPPMAVKVPIEGGLSRSPFVGS